MKFLFDAHLPRRLVYLLRNAGHDAVHTRDLPLQNRTPDKLINRISIEEMRVVVTKDADFVTSHLLRGEPYKLFLISTGNIKNSDLERLLAWNLRQIEESFEHHTYIELSRTHLIVHR
jgi:predicted nuclease of predicted toxin-antitoxin system